MKNVPVKGIAVGAIGVLLAGLILYYGRDLPVIKTARDGFGG